MADFKIERGLQLDYDGMLTKDADTMYVCTDTGNMYLGSQRLCYFIPDWDASQGEEGYIDHRPFYSTYQTTLQSTVLGASPVYFDWDIAPVVGQTYTIHISVAGSPSTLTTSALDGGSGKVVLDYPGNGNFQYDPNNGFNSHNGQYSGNTNVESGFITQEVVTPLPDKYMPSKVSKTGDTMTGDLTLNTGVKILLPSNSDIYDYYLSNEGDRAYLRRIRKDGTGSPYTIQEWRSANVYLRDAYIGGQQPQNIAINYQRVNNPTIDTSATLVGGITHLNELGTIDYSTIALPSSPGTAEYNGTFTSTTSGDITLSLPLTYWQGDTDIVSGKTYSFSIQNGVGFIIQLD